MRAARADAVFNALHGRFGEDGTVQGILEWMRLPYTHSGVLASALAMHKERTKDIYRAAGLPVVKSIVADRKEAGAKHLMEPPYVIKPVNEGSSVGIYIIRKGDNRPPEELTRAEWTLSSEMMVEEFVPGRELTVSVIGANASGEVRALGVTEITTDLAFYDYEAKYAPGGSKHILPAQVPANVERDCLEMAVRAHQALGCRGVSRTDFRYDDTTGLARLILLETNTQPGMTPTSLVPEQAAHVGMSYAKTVPLDGGGRFMRSLNVERKSRGAVRATRAAPVRAKRELPKVQPGTGRTAQKPGLLARLFGGLGSRFSLFVHRPMFALCAVLTVLVLLGALFASGGDRAHRARYQSRHRCRRVGCRLRHRRDPHHRQPPHTL